ncbi:MAG TPA: hypothetical protein VND54_09485 [Candidatus Saccharimonadales bacterium]|nr:hypothetical protein [Candidatus Saccharimonadales bacterium]
MVLHELGRGPAPQAPLSGLSGGEPATAEETALVDAVEVYHRTYTTILRSSGETRLRVFEHSHKAMGSSLHALAGALELDLGALLYAIRRLPEAIFRARLVVMGQSAEVFAQRGFRPFTEWTEVSAPGRRRRWYDDGDGTLAVLIASASDVDDLVPTMVALQIELNKLRVALRGAGIERLEESTPGEVATACGGREDDWLQLYEIWGAAFGTRLASIAGHGMGLRVRMLGGTQVGYARVTRRWWQQVTGLMRSESLLDRPVYFVSSNSHAIANLLTGVAPRHAEELAAAVDRDGGADLRDELHRFRDGTAQGHWNNFLYYAARERLRLLPDSERAALRREEREAGSLSVSSRTALDVAAQVIPLDRVNPAQCDERVRPVDPLALAASRAVIVNIDYPLGLAAYNILREVAETVDLRGVYILGKAATLNADVGDVMISSVVHDEHSRSTYWLDNAFSVSDIAPYLRFGSGLDNQRAVSVKGTFLQNRGYLDFYYREAFTVVEMEAGPYCNAVYEMTQPVRYPTSEPVSFSKLPIDFGVIHYASDTPYTQARTLGARGLSYFGMDSTYASSVAIVRRIVAREGATGQ